MKPKSKIILVSVLFLGAALFLGSLTGDDLKEITGVNNTYTEIPYPPESMDAYYPPISEQPVFAFAMLGMEMQFTGIAVNLLEKDFENANKSYEKFKEQYVQVSKLVPEWESNFTMEPVEELGKSLQSADAGKIFASIDAVGKVCGNCHMKYVIPVQYKYHWRDFDAINVSDQVTNENTDFLNLMRRISLNFTGIGVNLQEGQVENANNHFNEFKSRFFSMKATCTHCHKTPRKYYVDEEVRNMIDDLGKALNAKSIDFKLIEELSIKIGEESCEKCHLVHMPAAITKQSWKLQIMK